MRINFLGTRGSMSMGTSHLKIIEKAKSISQKIEKDHLGDSNDYQGSNDYFDHFGMGTDTISVMVENESEDDFLIIDCGTGITKANKVFFDSYSLNGTINILLTHFHWDHVIGLPFFIPLFIPGRRIKFHSPDPNLETYIKSLFKKPFFPVSFDMLPSDISFHKLEVYEGVKLANFSVTPYKLDHPDPCYGYRLDENGKSYSHCVDTEGVRTSKEDLGQDKGLYEKSDLMFFDAPYTLDEVNGSKKGWGHSCSERAIELIKNFGIKRTLLGHYTTDFTAEKRKSIQKVIDDSKQNISFSYDDLSIKI